MAANCDWRSIEIARDIPAGANYVRLRPNLIRANGVADIDDIQLTVVEGTRSAIPWTIQTVFSDNFEGVAGPLTKSAWKWGQTAGKSVVEESGNHFIRIQGMGLNKYSSVGTEISIKPEWKKLRISYKIRTQQFKANPADINSGSDLFVVFADEHGTWMPGGGTPLNRLKNDAAWTPRSWLWSVPPGAKSVLVNLSADLVTGITDFDDIKVDALVENSVKEQ